MRIKLKDRRKEYGYTQENFAEVLGISRSGYAHIEQGMRFPREKLMQNIMEKLEYESISLFENEDIIKRGGVTKNICKCMNRSSKNKQYDIYQINAIRKCLPQEYQDRKEKDIQISSRTIKGRNEIYKRIAELATKEYKLEITPRDVELFKQCTRIEYTDRTGKCTWSLPDVRKKLGHNPITGY